MPNATVEESLHLHRLSSAGLERVDDRRAAVAWTATSRGSLSPIQPSSRPPQRLVDADQPDAATGRVEDHVGHPPAELLGDLEPIVFLPSIR
jgi:hypothetical protein